MFARLYHNKCSKFLIIFLSKVYCKKGHGLYKNIKRWTQKRSKVKKRRKREKEKEMRIKITHVLAKIFYKREIYFREHSRIRLATKYSTHVHILVYEYDTSLLRSGVWLYDICKVSMLHILSLPKTPHKLFRSRKEKKALLWCALVRNQTPFCDSRVPFEEYKVNYAFLVKT